METTRLLEDAESHRLNDFTLLSKKEIKKLQAIHFGGDDESVTSEESILYEFCRPSPITDQELQGKIVVVGKQDPSVSSLSTDKSPIPGYHYPFQTAEMMIKFGICELCNLNITSISSALNHIISESHMGKWKYCIVCSKNIDLACEHIREDEHQKNTKLNCLLCNIKAPTENHMSQHLQGLKHTKKVEEYQNIAAKLIKTNNEIQKLDKTFTKDQKWLPYYSQNLENLILKDSFNLCNVELMGQADRRNHYKGEKHCKKEQKQKDVASSPSYFGGANKSATTAEYTFRHTDFPALNPKTKENVQEKQPQSLENISPLVDNRKEIFEEENQTVDSSKIKFCKLCRKKYKTSDNHLASRGHLDLANFKFLLEDKEIPISRHEDLLNKYHELVTPTFCGFCKGTQQIGPIELHLCQKYHNERLFQFIENIKSRITKIKMKQKINEKSAEEIPNEETSNQPGGDSLEINSSVDEKCTGVTASNLALQEQVKAELKKLADSLYFSKKVPLEKALEYLRRFNQEVEKYQKKPDITETVTLDQISGSNKPNLSPDVSNLHPDTISHNQSMGLTEPTETNNCQEINITNPSSQKTSSVNEISSKTKTTITETKSSRRKKKKRLAAISKHTEENANLHINDLIEDFINQEIPITQLADNNNILEIQVLTELTKLVDSVYNSKEIPLAITISCLENFNKEVDQYIEESSWTVLV